jgi:hypothetical protein
VECGEHQRRNEHSEGTTAITIKKNLAIARKPAAAFLFLHGKK